MSLSDRITSFDTEIANIDTEISTIDSLVIGQTAVASALSDRRTSLNNRKSRLNLRKYNLQCLCDNPVTESQQNTIDNINTLFNSLYSSQLQQFHTMTTDQRSHFFDIYHQIDEDATECKECFIRSFFNL